MLTSEARSMHSWQSWSLSKIAKGRCRGADIRGCEGRMSGARKIPRETGIGFRDSSLPLTRHRTHCQLVLDAALRHIQQPARSMGGVLHVRQPASIYRMALTEVRVRGFGSGQV